MNDVPIQIQEVILEERLQQWRNTQFQAIIDKRVADKLNDEVMKKQAVEAATNCEIAIAEIEVMIEELTDATDPQDSPGDGQPQRQRQRLPDSA